MSNSQSLASTERSQPALPANIRQYLDEAGRVVLWPAKKKTILLVLAYLASLFEPGQLYSEKEVNRVLFRHVTCLDYATVRRDLCDFRYLKRDRAGSRYWRITNEEKIL